MYEFYEFALLIRKASFLSTLCGLSYIVCVLQRQPVSFISDIFFSNMRFTARKVLMICLHILFIVAILFSTKSLYVNTFDTKDIRFLPDGEYCYYVKAEKENRKTYKLKAEISKQDNEYAVERLFFDNGGYIYLDSDYEPYGEKIRTTDEDHKEWEVKITSRKTRHRKVDEPEREFSLSDVSFIAEFGAQAFILLAHVHELCAYNKKRNTQLNLFEQEEV